MSAVYDENDDGGDDDGDDADAAIDNSASMSYSLKTQDAVKQSRCQINWADVMV